MILDIVDIVATIFIAVIVIANVVEIAHIRRELRVLNTETIVIGAKLKVIKDKL